MSDEPAPRPSTIPGGEVDVDRGYGFGVILGIAFFVAFQGIIVLAFQSPVISSELPLFTPLRFAVVSQLIYVFPSVLFFVNRKCPQMAYGFLTVAGVVGLGSGISLLF